MGIGASVDSLVKGVTVKLAKRRTAASTGTRDAGKRGVKMERCQGDAGERVVESEARVEHDAGPLCLLSFFLHQSWPPD